MIAKALAALAVVGFAMPAQDGSAPPTGERAGPSGAERGGPHADAPGGTPGGGPGGHRGAQVFLSPAGEPFRAPPGAPYPVAAWFAAADTDHDGALTLPELTADFDRFFARLDADHDGVIDGFEVADYEATIAPELLSRMDRPPEEEADGPPQGVDSGDGSIDQIPGAGRPSGGRGGGGRGAERGGGGGGFHLGGRKAQRGVAEGGGTISLLNLPEPVSGADRDFDGKVTREEWRAAAKARFRLLDKNGDGRLTQAELPLTRAQRLAAEKPKGKGKDGEKRKGRHGGSEHQPEM
ncbi:MAG: hypothetical protein JWP35_4543 [Caulobacter sp.]|nr:hypothetical protein [Caulobacter sp.]